MSEVQGIENLTNDNLKPSNKIDTNSLSSNSLGLKNEIKENKENKIKKEEKEKEKEEEKGQVRTDLIEQKDEISLNIHIDKESLIEIIKYVTLSDHVEYLIRGRDESGNFETFKRYRQFEAFRSFLLKKFLGFYIPSIPSKSGWAHGDEQLEERKLLLNDFFSGLLRYSFLFQSEDTKQFLKKESDFEKINKEFKQSTFENLLHKALDFTKIELHLLSKNSDEEPTNLIKLYSFSQKTYPALETLLKIIQNLKESIKKEWSMYMASIMQLSKLEKSSLLDLCLGNPNNLILGNPKYEAQLKAYDIKIEEICNPYIKIENFLKIWIMRLISMTDYYNAYNSIKSSLGSLISNITDQEATLVKLKQGGNTFSTFFASAKKKQKDIEDLEKSIPLLKSEIESCTQYLNLINLFCNSFFYNDFRQWAIDAYYTALKEFSSLIIMSNTKQKESLLFFSNTFQT